MAQKDTFTFKLISPEQIMIEGEEEAVIIPTDNGPTMIQPGYAPMIYALESGLVHIVDKSTKQIRNYFIGGGFAEVDNTSCSVLVQEAFPARDIDIAATRKLLEGLEEDLALDHSEDEKNNIRKEIEHARSMLQAVEGRELNNSLL